MPSQLSKGLTFNPGDTVEAADLNNLVDAAIARTTGGIISEQSVATDNPLDNTYDMLVRQGTALKRANISQLPGVTSVAWDTGYPQPASIFGGSVIAGTGAAKIRMTLDSQTPNLFLASPSGGAGIPSFRQIAPVDLPTGTIFVALGVIDCTQGNTFEKTLPAGPPSIFSLHVNFMSNGQTVRLAINQAHTGFRDVDWNTDSGTLIWRGGVRPVVTAIGDAKDIFTFTKIDVAVYAYADQNYKVVP